MADVTDHTLDAPSTTIEEDRQLLRSALEQAEGGEAAEIERLVAEGAITLDRAYRIWAEMLGLGFHSLAEHTLDARLRHRIPLDLAVRHDAIVVGDDDDVLSIALKNPFELLAVDEIQEVTGMPVEIVLATPKAIAAALDRLQRGSAGIEGLIQRLLKADVDSQSVDADRLRTMVGDDAVIQLVDHLIDDLQDRFGADVIHRGRGRRKRGGED